MQMQGSAALGSSTIPFTNPKTTTLRARPGKAKVLACRGSHNFPITEFNLYEVLGVDASSEKRQIKEAYRALQKRCHPDIAGPAGHDMAIVLNEAYALLCDPNSRMAYDKELAKVGDLQGYTGRPLYSVWNGSEREQRAVFVDEVKCIGCLKCALLAEKTFAVESVYGRARVVAQWADPEHKIQEAIAACPVDCISIVERSDLGALEFIMSKQARGRVRVGNTVDVFDEVEKFKSRYAQHKHSINYSQESEASRISAIEAIQMISNWLYWKSPSRDASSPAPTQGRGRHAGPSLKKLKAAAAARKQATASPPPSNIAEYWVPTTLPDSCSQSQVSPTSSPNRKKSRPSNAESMRPKEGSGNPLRWGVPMGTSMLAAIVVGLHLGEGADGAALQGHIGGSLALAIVNSSWMQLVLAALTWYLIAMYVVELLTALPRK